MSEQDVQAPEEASAETQEVLKELEAEGYEIAGKTKTEPETKVEEPPTKPKTEEPEESDAPTDEEPDEPDQKPKTPKREAKHVPVGKYNEERHKRQEAEAAAAAARKEAEELRANHKPADTPPEKSEDLGKAVKTLAEKHGVNEDFVTDLLETATKLNSKNAPQVPKELRDAINAANEAKARLEARELEIAQKEGFENEFAEVVKEFPALADQKEALKELAETEGNTTTPLRRLAIEYIHDNPQPKPGRKSAEAPTGEKGKTHSADVPDFENATDQQFESWDEKTQDEYLEWRGKHSS